MYDIRADQPLDAVAYAILRQVDSACSGLGIGYFLIGAMARDIILTHVFGAVLSRATRDVDFAVAVPNWAAFDQLKSLFLARPAQWAATTMPHRLTYRDSSMLFPAPIDLVPFGPIEDPPQTITWPPDRTTSLNVHGFSDAFHAAVQVRIGDIVVRIASLPGLVLLKLFAWADRHPLTSSRSKDAEDLLIMLRGYVNAGNQDRLYDPNEALPLLEACDYDFIAAGACLLGLDTAAITSEDTRTRILVLFDQADKRDQLVRQMAASIALQDNSLAFANSLLGRFEDGLRKGPDR